jgi:tRNA threonylcarbamoyladenosine biosynthesis protein TsaB
MLLAVDTSTLWIGLALYDESRVLSEMIWRTENHHTIELVPSIDALMKRCKANPDDLQALAVAIGPGSFTSLRISLAVIKGLALSRHLPIVGVPSLDVLAFAQPIQDGNLVAVLQAGRGRLAAGWYEHSASGWKASAPAKVTTADALAAEIKKPTLVCGELTAEERQVLTRKWKNVTIASPAHSVRRPSYLAEIAWHRWQAGQVDDPAGLAPIYLHISGEIAG